MRMFVIGSICLAAILTAGVSATIAGEVEFELATEPEFAPTDTQAWYQTLTKLKVANLSIRAARLGDKTEVITKGSKQQPIYLVKGVLKNNGELLLPGGRFKVQDSAGLSRWLEEMRTYGPQGTPEGKPLYGLNSNQFAEVQSDTSQRVDFNTLGVSRVEVFAKLREKLKLKMSMDPAVVKSFGDSGKVEDDLIGISAGTALACVLRPVGLAMRPERLPSGELHYVIDQWNNVSEPWPVGWPLTKRRQEVVPQLFEFIDVDIESVSLPQAMAAIGPRLEMPVVWDRNALAKHEIEISKINVSYPAKKSTYSIILARILGQGRLTSEVRMDEGNKPFVWITTIKK